jgi:hypothetical protein
VTSALIRIVDNPHSGAPCHFDAADLQGFRPMTITRFPKHLIFYQIEDAEITILRVVHGAVIWRTYSDSQCAAVAAPFFATAFFNANTIGTQAKQANAM